MKTSVYRFSLDVNQSQQLVSISAGRDEDGIRLIVRIAENGAPFKIEHGSYVMFYAVKPNGDVVEDYCAIFGDDTIVYDFNKQTVSMEGIVRCQLIIFNFDGSKVITPQFRLVVHETIPTKGIESADHFGIVEQFVADINLVRTELAKLNDEVLDEQKPQFVTDNGKTGLIHTLYGYRENEENKEFEFTGKGAVKQHVNFVAAKTEANAKSIAANAAAIAANAKSISTNTQNLTALTSQVNNPAHGLSAVERKIDNFLDVDDHTRDQLSEVLSLISANEQAIKQFVSMGGAPVGSGTLVVPASEWSDGSPTGAMIGLPANTMGAGSVMLLTPANDATKEAASKARLTVLVDISGDSGGDLKDYVVLLRAETAYKPEADMEFAFVILQTTAETSLVTLIGVDAAGAPAPTSVDLSAFDPDENGKGYITETYGEGEDAPKKVTEVTYDEAGNIIKIGNTAINWGGEA